MKLAYSFCLAIILAIAGHPRVLQAGGEPETGDLRVNAEGSSSVWSELRFEAGNLVGKVATTLVLSDLSMEALNVSSYTALEQVEYQLVPDRLKLLNVQGRAKAVIGGKSETSGKIWFDPRTGAVLQRERIRHGKEGVRKLYRFAIDGVARIRTEPEDRREARGSPDQWSRIRESFYPYDLGGTNCGFVSDPALLLYLISLAGYPLQGEPPRYCMFVDDALYKVHLEPAGTEILEVGYTVVNQGSEYRVEGRHNVAGLALRIEPLTEGADRADFELLEVRGDITLFVDKASRLPVQIRGQRRGIGDLNIRLENAVLAGG